MVNGEGPRGYAELPRGGDWRSGDDEDDGRGTINRKPALPGGDEMGVPPSEIEDNDIGNPERIDIRDIPELDIVPVTPNTDVDEDGDAAERQRILDEGILDNPKIPGNGDKDTKGEIEIN